MTQFKIGDKIVVKANGVEIYRGTLENTYISGSDVIALIRLSNGDLKKALLKDCYQVVDAPQEKTITRKELEQVFEKIVDPQYLSDELSDYADVTVLLQIGLSFILCKTMLIEELFGEK